MIIALFLMWPSSVYLCKDSTKTMLKFPLAVLILVSHAYLWIFAQSALNGFIFTTALASHPVLFTTMAIAFLLSVSHVLTIAKLVAKMDSVTLVHHSMTSESLIIQHRDVLLCLATSTIKAELVCLAQQIVALANLLLFALHAQMLPFWTLVDFA